ncbi:E3 ubiquitin/ISG15 ligase TRIM25-like [Garra rufa]|uniref:E3 ubiquitin/ISG15 ligase TRIM25-like n=1 Tax=Garra rufa TaxID=137080 RepID=UPI003CCEB6D0
MAESAVSQYEDQFSCPVCLDRLKEPVTIPCGHSYCMSCITDCWEQKEQEPPYRCPQCRESFSQRPLLKKNTLIAEMMETLQKTSLQTAAVECDVCTTEKNRAVKSCLQCLASFCQTHLQLHYQSPAFMKHKLVEASRNIQENICLNHGKLLEMYCQDDDQCICCLCTNNHNGHRVVSVDSEWTSKKKELKEIKEACQNLIQERERGQQELSEAAKLLKSSAEEAVENIEKVFAELICSLEKKRSEIKEQIRAQEKTEIDRTEELHKRLDQELTELRKRQTEIEKLLISDDQFHCLKSCQSVCVLPTFEDVPSITQHTHLSFKDISISAFREVFEDVCQQQTARICREVSNVHVAEPPEPKLQNDFFQYFCPLQLDPDTAGKKLKLSNGNKKASYSDVIQKYPDHPERFEFPYILCREGLYGRCYWEVECSGKNWAVVVCYKGIDRKGNINECRLGFNKKSWRFGYYKENELSFIHDKTQVSIPAVCSSRIGVYLDHRAGSLSFYSVSDTMTLLHRVQTTFTEPLYPAFRIDSGSSVLIIEKEVAELICSLEKKRSEIKEQIRAQEKTEIDRAEKLHKHLNQELTELRKRQTEIEKLLISDDHLYCLKSCQSVSVLPKFKGVPSFPQHTHLSIKDISISAFREVLEDACQQQLARISREVSYVRVAKPLEPKTPDDFLQYFCQLNLDPNTAHKNLKLSEENRKISCSKVVQQYSNLPERFEEFVYIMCREGLYGRCYWEVECSGDEWAVAVCYKGICRKGDSDESKLGFNKISWRLSNFQHAYYFAHNKMSFPIPAVPSSTIGVYLDHRAGTLSFYSVSDTMTLLHRVQTTFTEPLYPAFYTCSTSSIRIIEKSRVELRKTVD